jgi:D-3-phosphoglycerate dehydrogenase
LTNETRASIGDGAFSHGKNTILVNTSRGGIVDKGALAEALAVGSVGFFGTDVWWEEPPNRQDTVNLSLLSNPRVLVTPHVAWCSTESAKQVRRCAAEEVVRVYQGGIPLNIVNKDILKKVDMKKR